MVKNINFDLKFSVFSKDAIIYFLIFFFILFLKSIFVFGSGPLPDEAYYWLWSKNPDYSYYDHPPLSTWLQGLLSGLISSKQIQIRIVPLITFFVILLLNLHWMKLVGKNNPSEKLKNSVLLVSVPIYSIFLTVSFPDHLLILLIFLSGLFFYKFIDAYQQERHNYIYWYLSVSAFSFACLAKYNAIFFGVSVFIFLIIKKDFRKILLSAHFLIALFIFFLAQFPVVFWNIQNNYASFNFNLNSRLDFSFSWGVFLKNLVTFIFSVAFAVSPLLFFNILNIKKIAASKTPNKNFVDFCYIVFFVTFGFCFILSAYTSVLYYWSTVAFILFSPFLSSMITRRVDILLHSLFGVLTMVFLLINSTLYPLASFWGRVDRETAILYGWKNITSIIYDIGVEQKLNKVVFTDYRLASLYSFHSENYNTDAIMEKRDTQFDIWRKNKKYKTEKSLIIADENFPIHNKIYEIYSEIKFVRFINIFIDEKKIKTYHVYIGKPKIF